MKYVIVLSVLALLSALLYWRLRPYIKMARRVLGVVRDVRRMSVGQETADLPRSQKTRGVAEKLVRCDACGVWLPASRAVAPRSSGSTHYCSQACLERAAESQQPARKSAS